jgi:hypothetical protein
MVCCVSKDCRVGLDEACCLERRKIVESRKNKWELNRDRDVSQPCHSLSLTADNSYTRHTLSRSILPFPFIVQVKSIDDLSSDRLPTTYNHPHP